MQVLNIRELLVSITISDKTEFKSKTVTRNKDQHSVKFSSVTLSCPTLRRMSTMLTRPPCPSPTPGVHSNSRPSSWWCHPAISSSVPQYLPASESFPMSQLFAWSHYILLKVLIHHKTVTTVNIYIASNKASKYMKN